MKVKGFNRATDLVSGYFPGWLIVILMCVVLVEVITRYVARHPLGAASEISGLLMVLISFMGLAYTWKEKRHIRLTFVTSMLPARVRQWVRLIILAGILTFLSILSRALYVQTINAWRLGTKSFDLAVPVAWPQLFMFIGSVLFALWVLIDIVRGVKAIRSGEGGEA